MPVKRHVITEVEQETPLVKQSPAIRNTRGPVKANGKPKSTNCIPKTVNHCSRLLAILLLCVTYDVTKLIYDTIETMIDQIRTLGRWVHEKMTVF